MQPVGEAITNLCPLHPQKWHKRRHRWRNITSDNPQDRDALVRELQQERRLESGTVLPARRPPQASPSSTGHLRGSPAPRKAPHEGHWCPGTPRCLCRPRKQPRGTGLATPGRFQSSLQGGQRVGSAQHCREMEREDDRPRQRDTRELVTSWLWEMGGTCRQKGRQTHS